MRKARRDGRTEIITVSLEKPTSIMVVSPLLLLLLRHGSIAYAFSQASLVQDKGPKRSARDYRLY